MKAKKGRKAANWINPATNLPVVGLGRNTDGRWRIIETGKTFVETDTDLAIAKFKRLTSQSLPFQYMADSVTAPTAIPSQLVYNAAELAEYLTHITDQEDAPFWRRVAKELHDRPKYCAERTGIEELAYLSSLNKPEEATAATALLQLWDDNATPSTNDAKAKVKRAWKAFCEQTNIVYIHEITPEMCVNYSDHVHRTVPSGKQQQHLFNGARRVLTFAASRAIAVRTCNKALVNMRLMTPNKSTKNKKPKPISIKAFHKILRTSTGSDKAMVLLMLNACLYAGEVVRCKWSDFDLQHNTFNSRRKKKGEFIRVATLWPETVEALKQVERLTNHVFIASGGAAKGNGLKKDGAFNRLRELLTAAKVDVKPSHFRDGAFGAAVAANCSEKLVNIFTGHSNNMSDMYVLSDCSMVKPCCDAVYKRYFQSEAALKAIAEIEAEEKEDAKTGQAKE